jgi:poly(3-hydroxybutyrate) depolymerase
VVVCSCSSPCFAGWRVARSTPDPTAPEPIRKLREPVSAQNYFLYVPSRYDSARPVPLVVLCHGTTPWDSALREIRDWVGLAEAHNFIVAAPKLRGTRGDLPPPVAKQIERQHRDERTILNVVQHVRGAYSNRPARGSSSRVGQPVDTRCCTPACAIPRSSAAWRSCRAISNPSFSAT